MKIMVDDHTELQTSPDQVRGDVLAVQADLVNEGRIIEEITCEGQRYWSLDDITTFGTGEVRLSTRPIESHLHQIVRNTVSVGEDTERALQTCSTHWRTGRDQRGYKVLVSCLEPLEFIIESTLRLREACEAYGIHLDATFEGMEKASRNLETSLALLLENMEQGDSIGSADLIEYELLPAFDALLESLGHCGKELAS